MHLTKTMRVSCVLLHSTLLFPFWRPKLATLPSKFFQLVVCTSPVEYHFVSSPTCKKSISLKATISCKHLRIKEGLRNCFHKCRCMSFSIQKLLYLALPSTALRKGKQRE